MKAEKIANKLITIVFITFIMAFFILIMSQVIIKNVFIEMFEMDNVITSWSVTGGSDGMIDVDWKELYPFKDEPVVESAVSNDSNGVFHNVKNMVSGKVSGLIDVIDKYTTDYLPFQELLKVPSGYFDMAVGNKMVDSSNVYIDTADGGLIVRSPFKTDYAVENTDMSQVLSNIVDFNEYLKNQGIDFMYVQSAVKEDIYDSQYVDEYGLTLESTLANELVEGLDSLGIDVMDMRSIIHEDGLNCYDQFFVTDNHWNINMAFYAAGKIANRLNEDYGYNYDMSMYNLDNYDRVTYKDWLYGTVGRSVTLAKAGYDDIDIFYPKFETMLNIKIPNLNMDNTGTFEETMINPVPFLRRSTLYHGAFDAFAYSKPPLTEIANYNATCNEDKKILVLRESFAGPVLPYLALGTGTLNAITPEGFTGSIKTYIEQMQPDMVIILYAAPTTNEVTVKYVFE